ncbi:disks large-associated protein 1-like isoform X2 [Chironomus tepperi]|uniref:disks large-associated protein 1-like isoform X2 n=1 Tax=Chironomus tepperi TaxID=113505 RepID=UPI00391F624F
MDRSIDSIGSCSLDADSTDFSATRENFTAGISERVKKIQTTQPLTPKLILNQPANQRTATTTAYFDINSGKISTIVSRTDTNDTYINGNTEKFLSTKTIELQSPTVVSHANKKPSYLNLACCVNGYSNYTNYDSVERKEINKSREVSPIRPIITMSRQPRSNDNLLSVPQPVTFVKQSPLASITKRFASLNLSDGKDTTDNAVNGNISNRKSFIQQRVEKLYGTTKILTSTTTTVKTSEIINLNGNSHKVNGSSGKEIDEKENDEELCMNSLPVMKHLRPEFCRQLNFLNSPKKTRSTGNNTSKIETHIDNTNLEKIENQNLESNNKEIVMESETNNKNILPSKEKSENNNVDISNNNIFNEKMMEIGNCVKSPSESEIRDGHYFLKLLNAEKTRILKIADEVESELKDLQSDPSTVPSEEVVGIILSAIGKSRLLATKKFKQFEGLCYENLTPNMDGPQTLSGDLQGFWDMMMLQVDNIDAAFEDLQICRASGWKKPQPLSPLSAPKGTRLTKRPLTQNNKGKVAAVNKSSTASSEAAQKRDEQRKKLLEMKRKQKAAMQQNGTLENEALNDDKKEN